MRLRNLSLISGVISFGVCAFAFAQHTDQAFTVTSKSCAGINWSDRMLTQYPTIKTACQGVTEHDGVTYVKFSARVLRNKNSGKELLLDLKDGGQVTVTPPEATELSINGRVTPMAKLQRGDELNFYIPQNRVVAQFYAAAAPETAAPTVVAPLEPTPAAEPVQVAEALPSTASELPLVALSGLLMVALGGGLTFLRKRVR